MPKQMTPWQVRLWKRVAVGWEGECWPFEGYCHPTRGYGQMGLGSRDQGLGETHRLAYEFFFGQIPQGMCVCHQCDNPSCCNPNHLFLGSHADNMADMKRKGRGSGAIGSANRNFRISHTEVEEMKELVSAGMTKVAVADRYGVTPQYVGQLVNGRWRRHGV